MKLRWISAPMLYLCLAQATAHSEVIGGVDYPPKLVEFELKKIIDNETSSPGLGTTIYYNTTGVKVSVFVYDKRIRNIPDDADSSVVRSEFLESSANIRALNPNAKSVVKDRVVTIGSRRLLEAIFQYPESRTNEAEPVISHLILTTKNGKFVKIRSTYSAVDQPERGFRTHASFISALARLLR